MLQYTPIPKRVGRFRDTIRKAEGPPEASGQVEHKRPQRREAPRAFPLWNGPNFWGWTVRGLNPPRSCGKGLRAATRDPASAHWWIV